MTGASRTARSLGITPPLSLDGPTDEERDLQVQLDQALKAYRLRETDVELKHRETVLAKLREVLQEYAVHEGCLKGMNEDAAMDKKVQLKTYGSYRLQVHSPEADIDTLCIAPKHCTRASFFQKVPILLEATPGVKQVLAVPDAYTPVINMKIDGIAVDLIFVSLPMESIPEDIDVLDDKHLRNLDESSVRSLNGVRVTERILQLVPRQDRFRSTLMAVKYWARLRGIYSNKLGFLGGVNWAILVARICQLYPNALPATLLAKFFRIYHLWAWPNPILLDVASNTPNMGFPVWNPMTNPRDRAHLMPIITPAYPAMNSSYSVTQATLQILKREFGKAASRSFEIETKKGKWGSLFAHPVFFQRWQHYLRVQITAKDVSDFSKWFGWVESRLRYLIQRLECVQHVRPHPFARFYDVCDEKGEVASTWFFVALSFHVPETTVASSPSPAFQLDLTTAIRDFASYVDQWDQRRGGMDLEIDHMQRQQIPEWVVQATEGGSADGKTTGKTRKVEQCYPDEDTPHSRSTTKRAKEGAKEVKR
ncbi:hypothetical protein Poli38472_008324 [Pythium oligandrum]|uniref:Poly(A) polymerase n=1 Tax=Pythium oligandrum TaxID=41045 RepID=A0A8K1CNK2_PYTOL|nr:hypothetical protein Poli38472_008324 [Pythium oligandrum]|eukprot:TMW65682.1 hypothetical protein Poli38472_008324 [Pythium oligandrum]